MPDLIEISDKKETVLCPPYRYNEKPWKDDSKVARCSLLETVHPCPVTLERSICVKCLAAGPQDLLTNTVLIGLQRALLSVAIDKYNLGDEKFYSKEADHVLQLELYISKMKSLGEDEEHLRKYIAFLKGQRGLKQEDAEIILTDCKLSREYDTEKSIKDLIDYEELAECAEGSTLPAYNPPAEQKS